MISTSRIAYALASSVSLLAFASASAHAEDAAAAAATAAAAPAEGLTDIVVTAERRDVSLQQAPLSVSAITSETLKAANINDITGLNGTVPGLVVAKSGGGERIITIRGVGSETPENTNTQPGVSYHIDGVYIFNSIAASAAFIDVAQVEVLRGPQGTLFGQGSTGGTINVVSIEPSTDSVSGNVNAGYGNYNYMEGSGALNVPLSDTLAVRGAFQFTKHDGYAHATEVPGTRKYDLDDQDETGWRLGAKWQPASNFSIVLNTVQFTSNTNGPAQKNILDPNPDPRELTQDYPGRSVVKTQLYTGVVKWETPFATIKSITGYQKLHSEQAWDADGLDTALFYAQTYNPISFTGVAYDHVPLWESDTKSWSQEINLTSNGTGPFNWVLGGVYLHSSNSQYVNEYRSDDDNFLQEALPTNTAWNDPLVSTLTYAELSTIKRDLYAFFAQGTYSLTSQLKLTAGVRYNHDKATGMFDSMSGGASGQTSGAYLQPSSTGGRKGDAWTGKVALDYQITPANMVYASWTRGFKPGGINSAASTGNSYAVLPTYKQETVDSFEIGTKNSLLGNTLQLNGDVFYSNYRGYQASQTSDVLQGSGIFNVGSAKIFGIEGEVKALLGQNTRLGLNAAYLHTKFGDGIVVNDGDGNPADISGNRLPNAPSFTLTGSIDQDIVLGFGKITAHADAKYSSKYYFSAFNLDDISTGSFAIANASLGYEPNRGGWKVIAFVRNIFDKNVLSYAQQNFVSHTNNYQFQPPRTYGVRASVNF